MRPREGLFRPPCVRRRRNKLRSEMNSGGAQKSASLSCDVAAAKDYVLSGEHTHRHRTGRRLVYSAIYGDIRQCSS